MSDIKAPDTRDDSWPIDLTFPLADTDCISLVRGGWVRWQGTVEQLLDLPGRYEMIGGWICLKR